MGSQRSLRDNVVPELEGESVVFVSLNVEPPTSNQALANYTRQNRFRWTFAVATNDMLTQLIDHFGRSVATPPSAPHFIIGPDGTTTDLLTGRENPADLVERLRNMS